MKYLYFTEEIDGDFLKLALGCLVFENQSSARVLQT